MPSAQQETSAQEKSEESVGEERVAKAPQNREAESQRRQRGDASSCVPASKQAGRRARDPAGNKDEDEELAQPIPSRSQTSKPASSVAAMNCTNELRRPMQSQPLRYSAIRHAVQINSRAELSLGDPEAESRLNALPVFMVLPLSFYALVTVYQAAYTGSDNIRPPVPQCPENPGKSEREVTYVK